MKCYLIIIAMKTKVKLVGRYFSHFGAISMILAISFISSIAYASGEAESSETTHISGVVADSKSNDPLAFSTITLAGTHIATVCNSDGEFTLKIPNVHLDKEVVISFIGYQTKSIPISELLKGSNQILLDMTTVPLVEVNVFPSDPDLLIRAVMNRRDVNYNDFPTSKTAFYRETIRKGRSYVSLNEAIVDIYKYPYKSSRYDQAKLIIGRKSTDYDRLDTLVFKLQGGPVSALMLDIMKDPYTLFDEEMINNYSFEMANITRVDDRMLYVLAFKPKPETDIPLFFGKLYIDSESLAVTSASFNMDISDREEAARMFIRRKPAGARVYPTETAYVVNYREQNGKWFLGYTRAYVAFRVNWKRKVFNTNYYTTMEMAITDWNPAEERPYKPGDRLRENVIMEDAVEGFYDEEFWGDYNVIEPEQPIENAIRRIQKAR